VYFFLSLLLISQGSLFSFVHKNYTLSALPAIAAYMRGVIFSQSMTAMLAPFSVRIFKGSTDSHPLAK